MADHDKTLPTNMLVSVYYRVHLAAVVQYRRQLGTQVEICQKNRPNGS